MHPILILLAKILVDAIPSMTQDVSWTVINLAYMAVSFEKMLDLTKAVFLDVPSCHRGSIRINVRLISPTYQCERLIDRMTTGGVYDEYTLWEQIDSGAHYTPAKKWLTSVPIGL